MERTESAQAGIVEATPVTKKKLMEDLRTVVADAEELLKATAHQTEERIRAARGRVETSLKSAKARLAEVQETVEGKTKEAAKVTDEYVRANPWKAVGISAAIGFILGILITRR